MNNVAGATELAINVFGGENLEISPQDLPQGLSPSCPNMAFLPGSVFTRPPLRRLLTYPGNCQILYAKSYTKRDGTVVQIVLDSLGRIWADATQIGSTQAGNRIKSVTAFGREYIAISDGLHGADVPLQYDGTHLDRVSQDGPAGAPTLSNVPLPVVTATDVKRTANVVTVTAAGHGLRIGSQVAISETTPFQVGISNITIAGAMAAGVATVTTAVPHGLYPDDYVSVINVPNTTVGGGIQNTTRFGGILTCTTNTPNGIGVGATVALSGTGGDGTANGVFTVQTVESALTFTMAQPGTDSPVGGSAGNAGSKVQLVWPTSIETASQSIFQVQSVPSPTSFQISISYPDGTWNGGLATFAWDGTFYVSGVNSVNSFNYTQPGPDAETATAQVSPVGQIAPGNRSCVVIFQTRAGYLTTPGPPATLTAGGGQSVRVDNIPLGPPNVIARQLAFTAANGGKYFILPVVPMLNGQILGTSTVINDNTSTNAIFDFSDQSLLAGSAIDDPGNNLFSQVVLGPCLGIFAYAARLFAWGERNKIQQFLNMGLEGGYLAGSTQPLGWTISGVGTLVPRGNYGQAWSSADSTLSQTAYQDRYGVAILQPDTQYTFRCWATGTGTIDAQFVSASAGVLGTASAAAGQGFAEGRFDNKTPLVIPGDTVLRISARAGTVIDELEVYYTDNPFLPGVRASYVINPEGFDGVTGLIGPANDPHEVRALFERKDVLHMLTSGPEGSLYETADTASSEPNEWNISHVAAKCGASSVWGDAQFEDWQVWASDTGLRIYDGGAVEKMSQEVQPWWDSFNPLAKQFTVVANDPYLRRIYVLSATGNSQTTNSTYMLDYRELNTAQGLSSAGTLKVGYGGKVFTTDLTRKWSQWTITASFSGLLSVGSSARMVFAGSNGVVYGLNEGDLTAVDDDYGAFQSSYTTYFMLSADEAQQFKLGTHRKLFVYSALSISGTGTFNVTPLIDRVGNAGRPSRSITLSDDPNYDYEVPWNVSGDRVAFRIQGTGGFYLTQMIVALINHPHSPIRGSNRG